MSAVERRAEAGYPSLTARRHWRRYALGMATEVLFILVLSLIALAMAWLASVVWL